MYVFFFWANFPPYTSLIWVCTIISFQLFQSYMYLIWACMAIKIQLFFQQLYWRLKYRQKKCSLVWNINVESRFFSVWFELFPFIPSAQSSWQNRIQTWCLMVSRFSCHRVWAFMFLPYTIIPLYTTIYFSRCFHPILLFCPILFLSFSYILSTLNYYFALYAYSGVKSKPRALKWDFTVFCPIIEICILHGTFCFHMR